MIKKIKCFFGFHDIETTKKNLNWLAITKREKCRECGDIKYFEYGFRGSIAGWYRTSNSWNINYDEIARRG